MATVRLGGLTSTIYLCTESQACNTQGGGEALSEQGDLHIAVGPPVEPDYLRPVYANAANINFTPHDFRLMFSLFLSPLQVSPEDAEGGTVEIHPQAVAHVVVPATLMHALISLLQAQFGEYLKQFGPPGLDSRGPGGMSE